MSPSDPNESVVGVDRFGESSPALQVFKYLGIIAAHVVAAVVCVIAG